MIHLSCDLFQQERNVFWIKYWNMPFIYYTLPMTDTYLLDICPMTFIFYLVYRRSICLPFVIVYTLQVIKKVAYESVFKYLNMI